MSRMAPETSEYLSTRDDVLEAAGGVCAVCQRPASIALRHDKAGKFTPANLYPACRKCCLVSPARATQPYKPTRRN